MCVVLNGRELRTAELIFISLVTATFLIGGSFFRIMGSEVQHQELSNETFLYEVEIALTGFLRLSVFHEHCGIMKGSLV